MTIRLFTLNSSMQFSRSAKKRGMVIMKIIATVRYPIAPTDGGGCLWGCRLFTLDDLRQEIVPTCDWNNYGGSKSAVGAPARNTVLWLLGHEFDFDAVCAHPYTARIAWQYCQTTPAQRDRLCEAVCKDSEQAYEAWDACSTTPAQRDKLCESVCRDTIHALHAWQFCSTTAVQCVRLCAAVCRDSYYAYIALQTCIATQPRRNQLIDAICKSETDTQLALEYCDLTSAERKRLRAALRKHEEKTKDELLIL